LTTGCSGPVTRALDSLLLLGLYSSMTIYDLNPGAEYKVVTSIQDFHGSVFTEGQRLRFVERQYLPYDDGHTLIFTEDRDSRTGSVRELRMHLQGTDHRDAIENTDHYLREFITEA